MQTPHLNVLTHPILKHKLAWLRDTQTKHKDFRVLMQEVSGALAYEATRDLATRTSKIETPFCEASVEKVDEHITAVAIMRAGSGMLTGVLDMLPFAKVGHIGIYKDKFIGQTVEYYFKVPEDISAHKVLLLEPILATGDTISAAIGRLKAYGAQDVRLLTILSYEQGIAHLGKMHPDVPIFTLSQEPEMDEKGFLHPGIGNVSDRLFA